MGAKIVSEPGIYIVDVKGSIRAYHTSGGWLQGGEEGGKHGLAPGGETSGVLT